ncbi:integrin beta-1-like isoform X2 [Paramacrobiotus metropolitanus]|uniref:integrin beta-1-like isoform X2 n=1 Tax=Paramacrobiotus metropolitanus TaxID=2943436 RepID=UPI002445AED4|nr:integrin beta-1-like isoform X2 [Paramacrobiotus metropolitanus]
MLRTFAVILFVSCGHHHGVFANPVNNTCIEPNPPNRNFKFYINEREPCSGRGTCVDGQCTSCRTWEGTRGMFSKKRIVIKTSGKYCECDNVSCPAINGEVCDGHGHCDCGRCVCDPGYTFSDCSEKKATVERFLQLFSNNNANQNQTSA